MPHSERNTATARWRMALCLTALLSCCGTTMAHGPLHERLAHANQKIKNDPTNATHYTARAELSFEHADFAATLRDLDQAKALGDAGAKATLLRARTLSAQGKHDSAIELATTCIEDAVSPAHALAVRADLFQAMGKLAEAATDLQSAVDASEKPSVQLFLKCAGLHETSGDDQAARTCLERARASFPKSSVLQVALCDLVIRQGAHEDALKMLDDLIAQSPRAERWLVRKADILATTGRHDDAAQAARAALALIEALPPRHRNTPAMKSLRKQALLKVKAAE
jgi:tetratricopeptide (TPR) repeat protein